MTTGLAPVSGAALPPHLAIQPLSAFESFHILAADGDLEGVRASGHVKATREVPGHWKSQNFPALPWCGSGGERALVHDMAVPQQRRGHLQVAGAFCLQGSTR
jgi:hypothetical protein